MSKLLAKCRIFLQREILSVWIVTFGLFLNILAWVIPFGRLRHPSTDPIGAVAWVAALIENDAWLRSFWNGVLALTITMLLLSTYEIGVLALQATAQDSD